MPEGTSIYFKPRLEGREREFEGELQVMARIEEIGLKAQIRFPELYGIVVLGQDGGTVSRLLEPTGVPQEMGRESLCHGMRAVCPRPCMGDVNPTNIMIDEGMDAWIIDFGGMNNVKFVDEENRETMKGDWQGVRTLFQKWLPIQAGLDKKVSFNVEYAESKESGLRSIDND
ncbi:hypothetical protein ACMFMG_008595 [Clarireedia jacksonii]